MATKTEISINYKGPKSICMCGHGGDGTGIADSGDPKISLHGGISGHGACMHGGGRSRCKCQKFTWAKFTTAFERAQTEASDAA